MTAPPHLSLTFDDGPDTLWTAAVLSALNRCDVTATFFMVGARVEEAPEMARAVVDAGSQIQLHCHRHVRHLELTEREIEQDTLDALDVFARIGVRPTLWRTPWGVRTSGTRRVAERNRLRLVNWTIDAHDWRGDSVSVIFDRLRPRLADGGVVLMHDALGPGARRSGCESTVAVLAPLIAEARSRGVSVGPLSHENTAIGMQAVPLACLGEPMAIGYEA